MRGEYNTWQKRELLGFLKEHELENFSVDDVVLHMQNQGAKIGRSTVYRYLEALADQGSVRKYQNAQGMTQYQHVRDDGLCDRHFHMMCKQCGAMYHVDCDLMKSLMQHVRQEHDFDIDPRETVLVGLCGKCRARNGEGADGDGADYIDGCHHCL